MSTGKLYNIGYISSQWISSNTLHSWTISCNTFIGPAVGGTATPAGSTGYVQYNTASALDGDPQFTYDGATNTLRISGAISSTCISAGTIITSDISIYGDTISGLTDPTFPSAASNKHYVDTVSGNLATKTIHGAMAGNIGANFDYGISSLKYISSQAISGQWRMPIYKKNKPTAAAAYEGWMIMSSGSTSNKALIWVCAANSNGSSYDWIQIGIGL